MSVTNARLILGVLILLLGLGKGAVHAQNNRFTERSFISSPVVRGMGDAGVALPGIEQSFFYNPAHLPRAGSHFTILGTQGAASLSIQDQVRFYNRQAKPAVDASYDLSTEALADLHRKARALGRQPSRGHGAVLLPSFIYSTDAFGVGGGLFAKTTLNYRIEEGSVGIPTVHLLSRTDLMALASLGVNLGVIGPPISIGLTGTQTRRFLGFKNEPLGRISDQETAVRLEGTTFQVDAGLVYTPEWLSGEEGTLRVAGAVYDLMRWGYGYVEGGPGRMPFVGAVVGGANTESAESIGQGVERTRRAFALKPSYRVGLAYQVDSVFFLEDVAVTADYQGYRSGVQVPLARVHLGARAHVVGPLRLRAGLSSGYPSGGIGLGFGALHVDYAVHGVEEGRTPGQLSTYVHTARVLLRLE
jgi:hypothetical protein